MKIKTRIFSFSFLIAILYCNISAFAQQDALYSQYMFNPIILNPAIAGSKDVLNVSLMQRYQWVNMAGAPQTQTISVQTKLKGKKVGLGLNIANDKLGPRQTVSVLGSYAYHIRLPKGKLSLGLRAGFYSYSQKLEMVDFKDKADVLNTNATVTKTIPTGDFGMYYYTRDFYATVAATHIWGGLLNTSASDKRNAGVYTPKLYSDIFSTVGKAFGINDNLIINPSVMIRYQKGSRIGYDVNCNVRVGHAVWLGLSYRSRYGLVALTRISLTEKLKVGYSYDFGFNQIGLSSGGTHEIYLAYDFNLLGHKIASSRYF